MKKFCILSFFLMNMFKIYHGELIEVLKHRNVDNILEDTLSDPCQSATGSLPVVSLINHIASKYLNDCSTIVLYDDYFYKSDQFNVVIDQLMKTYPYPSVHGRLLITGRSMKVKGDTMKRREQKCNNFVLLTKELEMVSDILGKQPDSRIIIVPLTSLWQLSSFLTSPVSQNLVNLLVLFDPSLTVEGQEARNNSKDIIIYTHLLFTDSLGATVPKVMTVWRCNRLTQPHLNLFPNKFQSGFNGYLFRLSGAQQPPFVFRKKNQQSKTNVDDRITTWDGYEVRLLQLVSEALNFTIKIEEPADSENASDIRVIKEVRNLKADFAIAGIPATADRMNEFSFSTVHSHDCANFITLTSTALPKYRAILGPFRLEVWICLIVIYVFAIIPISFSARHTLKHLLKDPWEIENMFWYVFGTFTNCFTFVGKGSWTSGKNDATRLFIGTYWVFTIIITAAYTGCIIAFITLPAYPPVLDTAQQLLKANYRIGILNGSGWQAAFENSSDKVTDKLLKKADFVPNLELGLKNVSRAVYWKPYAFLGSKEEMKFMINTNYSPSSRHKKSLFHLSKECFVPLMVSTVFSKDAVYKHPLDVIIMRAIQSGLFMKLSRDVEWDQYRLSTGKLMQVSSSNLKMGTPEDRQLTLDDTQGMFLLLGVGVLLALIAFFAECSIALRKRCKAWLQQRAVDDASTSRNVSVVLDAQTSSISDYLGILHSENHHRSQIDDNLTLNNNPLSLSLMSLEESLSSQKSVRRFSF